MTSGEETNLLRVIGQLEGTLEQLMKQNDESRAGRQKVHEGLERVRLELQSLNNRVETAEKTIKAMQPLVSEFERWRQRGLGAWAVLVLVLAALGWGLQQGAGLIWSMLTRAIGGGP